jgi:8-oxo-dGTP diphosphatase
VSRSTGSTGERVVVGAVIVDPGARLFIQRRSDTRAVFPGCWDIVGGHVEPGESLHDALAREINEETGWTLRRIVSRLGELTWEADGQTRREIDFLVEVNGNLDAPRLECGKHTEFRWIYRDELAIVLENRSPADDVMLSILTHAFVALDAFPRDGSSTTLPTRSSRTSDPEGPAGSLPVDQGHTRPLRDEGSGERQA